MEKHTQKSQGQTAPSALQFLRPPPPVSHTFRPSSGSPAAPGLGHPDSPPPPCSPWPPQQCFPFAATSAKPPVPPLLNILPGLPVLPQLVFISLSDLCSSMILSLFLFPGLVLDPETLSQSSQTPDYSLFPKLMLHFHTTPAFAQDVHPFQMPFLPMACPKALEKLTHPSWPSTYPLLQRQNRSFLPCTLCHSPDANWTCTRVMKDSSIPPVKLGVPLRAGTAFMSPFQSLAPSKGSITQQVQSQDTRAQTLALPPTIYKNLPVPLFPRL